MKTLHGDELTIIISGWIKVYAGKYKAGRYTVTRKEPGMLGGGVTWILKFDGTRVYSGDTLARCKTAATIHINDLEPNLFYNWPEEN